MAICQRSYPALDYAMDPFDLVEYFDILEDRLAPTREKRVKLLHGLWDSIPEEILSAILMRLPVATQCRLRAVCKRWRFLLSAPSPAGQCLRPTGTILSKYKEERFFCHKENRWFRFPFQPREHKKDWQLVATDGGLLCYDFVDDDLTLYLLVCNPITGAYHELFPNYPGLKYSAHFFVDLESKTFRVVVMGTRATLTFDSKRNKWNVFKSLRKAFPGLPQFRSDCDDHAFAFVWKNVVYKRAGKSRYYIAINMELGVWSKEYLDLPCDIDKFYHLESWKDQVVLVQLHPSTEDPVRIWMLRNNGTNDPGFSCLDWEKVPIKIPKSMKALVSELHYCLSYGRDYVCFTAGWTHHWVKYTFETRRWQVMPRLSHYYNYGNFRHFDWFNFEPQAYMDPTLPDCEDGGSDSSDDCDKSDDSNDSGDSDELDDAGEQLAELNVLGEELVDSAELYYEGFSVYPYVCVDGLDDSSGSDKPDESAEPDGSEDSSGFDKPDESALLDGSDDSSGSD